MLRSSETETMIVRIHKIIFYNFGSNGSGSGTLSYLINKWEPTTYQYVLELYNNSNCFRIKGINISQYQYLILNVQWNLPVPPAYIPTL